MDIKDVESLAALARIELKEDEKKELLSDMDSILGYVKQIEDMKTEEGAGADMSVNVWREDSAQGADFSKEMIAEQFPDAQGGFLKVKKIL